MTSPTNRSDLRTKLWEISGGWCEHPVAQLTLDRGEVLVTHGAQAWEMAHIWPRGMGHTGYRDTINNVMAACLEHARSTDDLTHEAWKVFTPQVQHDTRHPRQMLQDWVVANRRNAGWDL